VRDCSFRGRGEGRCSEDECTVYGGGACVGIQLATCDLRLVTCLVAGARPARR